MRLAGQRCISADGDKRAAAQYRHKAEKESLNEVKGQLTESACGRNQNQNTSFPFIQGPVTQPAQGSRLDVKSLRDGEGHIGTNRRGRQHAAWTSAL